MPEPTTPAGATPAVGGAPPSQSTPATPAAGSSPATPPATGDDGLGDAGKATLTKIRGERDAAEERAKAAEAELAKLRTASQTEAEKALAEAKRAGETEASARFEPMIRRTRVELALAAAGVGPKLVPLVARADEFAALKVEDGAVKGLDEAIAAVKAANPDWFTAQPGRPSGSIDLGAGAGTPSAPDMNAALRALARGGS